MEYLEVLNRIRDGAQVKQEYIEGGQTEGRLRVEETKPKPKGKNIMTGFQYADYAKLKEKLDDLQVYPYII